VKIRAIVNLRAGVAAHRALDALAASRPSWSGVEVRLTEGPAHATALAREAVEDEAALVLAAGGDGTVNEVAAALIGSGALESSLWLRQWPRAPCASPAARPGPRRASRVGVTRRMDVGQIKVPFLNVAGVGSTPSSAGPSTRRAERGRRIFTYVRTSIRLLRLYAAPTCTPAAEPAHTRLLRDGLRQRSQYGAGPLNPGA
jgi:diacylglycerol kinase family enzyme